MRKVVIGDATLYHGDAREAVDDIEAIDLAVSDLPYLLQSGGNKTGEMGGKFAKGSYDNSGQIIPCTITFAEIMPLFFNLMERGHAYFMVNNRHVAGCINEAEAAGFHFHNLLVWDKGTGTPNRWYMKNCEFAVFVKKGPAFYINDCSSRQLIKCPNVIKGDHETEKPVPLMEHYISNSSQPGQIVCDLFMGVGTTGQAAIMQGRKFIGCELNEKYFEHACRRIEAAMNEQKSFL